MEYGEYPTARVHCWYLIGRLVWLCLWLFVVYVTIICSLFSSLSFVRWNLSWRKIIAEATFWPELFVPLVSLLKSVTCFDVIEWQISVTSELRGGSSLGIPGVSYCCDCRKVIASVFFEPHVDISFHFKDHFEPWLLGVSGRKPLISMFFLARGEVLLAVLNRGYHILTSLHWWIAYYCQA